MALFEGITARRIETDRIVTGVLEREGDDPETAPDQTLVLVHGNVSSALLFQEFMLNLPVDLRVVAIDLRGFGDSEHAPIDATRGLGDFADDLAAALTALEIPAAHLFGWSMGAGVVLQYALTRPALSLVLQSPVSPYGFGGTRRDGSRIDADDAGCGAGGANPDFVLRLEQKDASTDSPASPRSVLRTAYVAEGYESPHEDTWVESMLTTSTAVGNYPGESRDVAAWPGFGPGRTGVLNAMAPSYFDVSGIVDLELKPPVLWIRGTADVIVSDTSLFDLNQLGALEIVPDWPGAETAPPQPMVTQTRDVLAAYVEAGGTVEELALDGVGHSPHLEALPQVRAAVLSSIGYVGRTADPAPPTEAIILRAYD